ncbi:MAG: hypothetical protein GDA51_10770 [Ekhidna sp.]|nr:hypothetical protein [Ekhidna sp.]
MLRSVLLSISLFLVAFSLVGQNENKYADEDLIKYALVMKWAEEEKDKMTAIYNGWIRSNEVISTPRFLKIKNAADDSLKWSELDVVSEEMKVFNQITNDYDSMVSSFTALYKKKIKEEISAVLYNNLRKDLKNNNDLKARYKTILDDLKEDEEWSSD